MKKAFLVFIVLISLGLLAAVSLPHLNLDFAPITPELVREVALRNGMIRGYSWAPGTPTLLPNSTGIDENIPGAESYLDYDFGPYVSVDGGTDLSTLTLGWSQSTNLTVTRPDPAFPFILRFTPRVNWFGDAPVWLSIFQVVDGVFTNPVSIGITIRVKNVPTPPTFHFPNISSPGAVGSGYIYERTEGFAPWTVDFSNIVQYYDGTGFNLFLYPTEFPEPILAEQRNTANGPIVNGGKIVTFRLNPDHPRYPNYYGTYRFGATAVDNHSSGAFRSTTFDIRVANINDAPEITLFSPDAYVVLDQDDSQSFSVNAIDVDLEPLTYQWVYEYTLNGIVYTETMQTTGPTLAGTDSFTHIFNIPGIHTITCNVIDAAGLMDTQVWQVEVHPEGPQFDPEGLVEHPFSQSVTNLTFGTEGVVISAPGIDPTGLVIYYTATSTDPLVPSYPVPQVYTGPIPIPIPPQNYTYTITAWYTHPDYPESQHVTRVYRMTGKVATPVFVEPTGIIRSNDPYPVHITCSMGDCDAFYYSYDGGPWTLYTGVIMIPAHTVASLRAYAVKAGWIDSDPSGEYVYDVRKFVVFPAPNMITYPDPDIDGNYCVCINDSVAVTFDAIATDPAAATIYYQVQTGINMGGEAIDPYSYPAPIHVYDPLNPPDLAIYHTSTIVWWAQYTDPDPDYLISDIHRYPIPVKNRTRLTYWGGGNDSVFNPPAGTYTTPIDVFINTTTVPANATIWYTIDGGAPQPYLGGAIHVDESTVLVAYASPMPPLTTLESLHQTAAYNITGTLPAPLISPAGFPDVQMYEDPISVTMTMPAGNPFWAGATIRYTINGDEPTIASTEYLGPIPLNQGHWQVRARAFLTDWVESSVAHTEYFVKFLPAVTYAPEVTTHYNDIIVEMYSYDGAQIRYTTNGDDPTAGSPMYGAPIPLAIDPAGPYTRTYRASAFLPGWVTSDPSEITYTMVPTVANPNFFPVAVTHDVPITVTIDTSTPGATIWYTLDGSEPGPGNPNSIVYTDPGFVLGTSSIVRAIAVKEGFRSSEIVRQEYVIGSSISALIFTPAAGTYTSPQNVSIIASPPNAEIWYTTDTTDPEAGVNGTLYAGPINLLNDTQTLIKAVAVLPSWQPSTGQAFYTITGKLDSPLIDPAGGQYTLGTNVDVTISVTDGDISYTINNGPVIVASSPVTMTINSNTTIIAKAVKADWIDSDPVTAIYTFNPALNPPLISPVSGTYYDPVQVVIYSTNPGSEIYYTLDPDPTVIPNILYTHGMVGFTLNGSGIVRAISRKADWLDSSQAQANYILKSPVPVFTPPAGSYAEAQNVTINGTGLFDIWYTTDGSVPGPGNPNAVLYDTPIPVNAYTRFRAVAIRENWQNSEVVEAIYVINGQLTAPVFSLTGGTYMEPVSLSITASPAGAQIYYWLNGSVADSTLYTVPILIEENTQVRARSYLANWIPSNNAVADYFLKVKPISGTPAPAVYYAPTSVVLSTLTPAASIYYTLDGTLPSLGSTLFTDPIPVNESTRIRAIAYKNGLDWLPSDLYDQNYVISQQVAAPEFDPVGGVFTYAPVNVGITTSTPDATIWYSIGGGAWTEYTTELQIPEGSTVVRAYAQKATWADSPIVTMNYLVIVPTVEVVSFNPPGGTYNTPQSVTISTSTAGADIYYTLGAGDPDILYNGDPLIVSDNTTIRAKAVLAGHHDSAINQASYIISPLTVLSPVLTPEAGVYYQAVTVRMYPRTAGSTILYRLGDGAPELEYDPLNPPVVTNTTLVRAKAVKAEMLDSEEVSALYTITGSVQIPAGIIDPAPGIYNQPVQISLNPGTIPADAAIYYTLNGENPVNAVSATNFLYVGPFMISPVDNPIVTVKVRAFKDQWQPSDIATATYTFQAAAPVFNPASGNSIDPINVTISSITPGVQIRYTINGNDPNESSTLYVDGITVPADSYYFIKAVAYKDNWLPSALTAASYNVTGSVANVSFNLPGGIYTNALNVVLSTTTVGGTIHYTTDGSEPDETSPVYTVPVYIPLGTPNFIIKAKAYRAGWDPSATSTATYTVTGQVSMGIINPVQGTYANAVMISIGNATPADASIYYTTDGTEPTQVSDLYNGAFIFNAVDNPVRTIKAKAFKNDWLPSSTLTSSYTFQAEAPLFNPPSGSYGSAQEIVLTTGTTGATIYYTTDGSEPTQASTLYTGLITVTENSTIRARAYNDPYLPSPIVNATYGIGTNLQVVAMPIFNIPSGVYQTPQSVIISTTTANATIYYTTDGSEPTVASAQFDPMNPIVVGLHSSVTIRAMAARDGWIPSQIATATYTVTGQVAPVTFNPPAGTYTAAQQVALSSATMGAFFRYTTNGSEPDESSALYSTPILISVNTTLKARAYLADWAPSETSTAVYTMYGSTAFNQPLLSPQPGNYNTPQMVTIADPIPAGAAVYYTLDGSIPTPATGILYTGPFWVDGNATVSVIAWIDGWDSPVYSGNYAFFTSDPVYAPIPGYYADPVTVTITSATPGTTIYYTMDGSQPTLESNIYTEGILINDDTTFKAVALKDGYTNSNVITGIYGIGGEVIPTVGSPVFDPIAGTYTTAQSVTISSSTPGAIIRYTVNGGIPTETIGTIYTDPIELPINTYTVIRAIAYMESGYYASPVVTSIYNITGKVSEVIFTPPAGTYQSAQLVQLSSNTPGAYFRYTLDGSEPTMASTLYTGSIPVPLNTTITIKAKGYKDGWETSDTGIAVYNTTGVTAFNQPVFTPAPGVFNGPINVVIAAPIPANANVFFSLDGSYPTIPYTGAIPINANSIIRAIAVLDTWTTGEASGSYTFNVASPVFAPPAGYYETAQNVVLTSSTPGATIIYTTDGTIPSSTNGSVYNSPIVVSVNQTIRAYAFLAGYNDSPLVAAAYTIGQFIPVVANPVFSPTSTTSFNEIVVSISSPTPGAQIRYTTDSSDPGPEYGILYTGPITVPLNTNMFIKAIAFREGWTSSAIVAENYMVTGTVQAVTFNPPGGTYSEAQAVVLSTLTEGATIRYTTDGTEPTAASMIYTLPINVPLNTVNYTIKARAFRSGWQSSVTATAIYTVTGQVAFNQPVFIPAGGTYGDPLLVSIAAPIPADASVYYTTNGTIPSPLNGNLYTGPFAVNEALTVKAIAVKNSWISSAVQSAEYTFRTAVPAFNPPGGWYASAQNVVLSSTTAGATIRYTTNGTIPTAENGFVYSNPIPVSVNQVIRAYAMKDGYLDSEVISHTYAIGSYVPVVATPVFSINSGTYPTVQNVGISVSTAGATIRYTTDGSDPSDTYGTIYTGTPITIPLDTTMTIKAIAYRPEWQNSQISVGNYIITGTVAHVVFTPPAGTYATAQNVVLTSATVGAYFRYTTDGSEPNAGSTLYTTAINVPLNSTLTIKAKAYKTDWITSDTGTAIYNITGQVIIPEPVFSLASGTYTTAQTVSVANPIPNDAIVRYTTDGSDPTSSSAIMPPALSLPLATLTTLKVRSFKADWTDSPVYTAIYNVTGQVVLPVNMFDPPSGTYQNPQVVHLVGNTIPSGAVLRYTLNGGEPNELSPAYSLETGIPVNGSAVLRVKGFLPGWVASTTNMATYVITGQVVINSPVFNPAPGTYTTAQAITISNTSPGGAVVRYTTDGSEPDATSPVFPQPLNLPLDSNTTIKVKAFLDDWTPSATHTAVYMITGQVTMSAPVFTPTPDVYTDPISVTINDITNPANAQIRYTLDGSDPNEGSALYTGPIAIGANQAVTVRARAFLNQWIPSVIHTASYNVTGQAGIVGVVFTPDPAVVYTSAQTVVINTITNPPGAAIHFTTDGTEPGAGSPVYSGQPIQLGLSSITTIKAKVIAAGWTNSPTYTAVYTITGQVSLAGVGLVPAPGIYQTTQSINVTGLPVPNDAVLRYTTDGTDPIETSELFTGLNPDLNSTLNLKIRGFKTDWIPSLVLSGFYQFTGQVALGTPMFTPVPGTYQTAQMVQLNTATVPAGATLRYTLDGSVPSLDSPAYTAPINVPLNTLTTITVRGFLENWTPSDPVSGIYNITGAVAIAAPVFTPPAGIYTSSQTVTLGMPVPATATIRYTTDGSEPDENSAIYDSGIVLPLATTTTLKARAFLADWTSSPTYTAVYQITGQVVLPAVVFDPIPGIYTQAVNVTINTATLPADAVVHYTVDGSDPNPASLIYSAPIPINGGTVTIRVRAFKDNWIPSEIAMGTYNVTGQVVITAPVFSLESGIYTTAQTVSVNQISVPTGATIRYTTDGTDPTETSPVYSSAFSIPLNSSLNLKVRAYLADWIPSPVYSASYTVTGTVAIATPVFSVASGTYTTAQSVSVNLGTIPNGATIRYTFSTDGSIPADPTETSPVYTTAFSVPLNSTMNVKVRAFLTDWVPSPVYSAAYTVTGQISLPTPMFTPAAGTYQTAQTVFLNTATTPAGTTLRYTTNGADPTEASPAYSAASGIPLPLYSGVTVIKVQAYKQDWIPSPVVSATYNITGQLMFNTPIFTPAAGTYTTAQTIEINGVNTTDAQIRYTTDGTDPTQTSTLYTGPFTLNQLNMVHTVKARAFKTDWTSSAIATAVYNLTGQAAIEGVVFNPAPNPAPANTYTTPQSVTISTTTTPAGAVVRYTTDGTVPTVTSPVYAGPIEVGLNTTMTIRARAFANDWTPSEVYSGVYRVTGTVLFNTATVFSPAAGTYTSAQVITVSGNTTPAGAAVHYTTDGSEPSLASPVYTAGIPLPLDSTTTIKIKGFAEGWISSQTYEATYNITGMVSFTGDYFTPPAGTYTSAQDVQITAIVYPGAATIHYTTDGTDPDQTSPIYSGAINIPLNTPNLLIKARAYTTDWIPSPIISAEYKITGQVALAADLLSPVPGTYTSAQTVTVNPPVLPTDAVIRYTIDGSEPTSQSPAYTNPINIPLATQITLKLKGFAVDWIASETVTAVYNVTGQVASPEFNYPSGMYINELQVVITTETEGAEIRYTTDGEEPTASSELYTGPVVVPILTNNRLIRAKAFKTDWITSAETSAVYSVITLPYNVRLIMYEGYVRILWNSDIQSRGLDGFYVYRMEGNNPAVKLNPAPTLQTIGPDYYWDDYTVSNFTTYHYYVTAVYDGVESNISSTVSVEFQAQELEITNSSRVYPNPAENSTTIQLRLSRNDNVQISVSIFDFAGKKVRTLTSNNPNTNFVEIPWDLKNDSGTKVARGTYFARVVAKDSAKRTEKVIKISVK